MIKRNRRGHIPITPEVLALFTIDPAKGKIRWAVNKAPLGVVGQIAGCALPCGYWQLSVGDQKYKAHRIIWAAVHGDPGAAHIDHIDGDGLNNRISNLRLANHRQNNQNRQHLDKRNRTGVTGVFWRADHERWQANIRVNRKTIYLGSFLTKEEAVEARRLAEIEHFGEFAPLRNRKPIEPPPEPPRWPEIQGDLFPGI